MGTKGKLSTHGGNKKRTKRLVAQKHHKEKMEAKRRKRDERCEERRERERGYRKVSPIARMFLAPIVQIRARFL